MVGITRQRRGQNLDDAMSQNPSKGKPIDSSLTTAYESTVLPVRRSIANQGYGGLLDEASKRFAPKNQAAHAGYIPVDNLFEAYWFISKNPTPQGQRPSLEQVARVGQLLFAGAPTLK
jgi:hypothetical protein